MEYASPSANSGLGIGFSNSTLSGLSLNSGFNARAGSSASLNRNWGDGSSPTSVRANVDHRFSKLEGKSWGSNPNMNQCWANGSPRSMPSVASASSFSSLSSSADVRGVGPAFVFVVDVCSSEEDLRVLKNELLLVVEQLPESALVALVTFDSMVRVHDLGFPECSRVVVFHGERELSADQVSW